MKSERPERPYAPALQRSNGQQDTKKIHYKKSDAVKYLESLYLEKKKARFPNIPPQYLVEANFRDDTANALTRCIIAFLQLKGHQAERISTTGWAIDRTKTFTDVLGRTRTIGRVEWIPGTSTKGSSDISETITGQSVKIEVKVGKDKQSQAQKDYQKAIEAAGGIYFIARSFVEFLKFYKQAFKCHE
jgi:hypothetical protein